MHYSPIIVFAFNRLDTLRNTIESLRKNAEAADSDLYVFVDGPRLNKDGEEQKVRFVQEYVTKIYGFRTLHYKFSNANKGLGNSIIAGVTEVINVYGRAIVLEDDLILAPSFLNYMNVMLDAFECDKRIMQVTGFSTVAKKPQNYRYDYYLNRRGESWSWATWKDRWDLVDWAIVDYEADLSNKQLVRSFRKLGSDLPGMLSGYIEGKNQSWAIRFCYSMFKLGKYTLCPLQSLVANDGFSDEGTNCKGYNRFTINFNQDNIFHIAPVGIEYSQTIDKSANRYWNIWYRIYGKIYTFLIYANNLRRTNLKPSQNH